MALSRQNADELFDILSRGWDQKFSAADLAQLEAFVRTHGASACEQLIQFSSMHVELDSIIASSRAYDHAMAAITAGSQENEGREANLVDVRRARSERGRAISSRWVTWLLAAALMLAVGGHFWLNSVTDKSAPVTRPATLSLFRPPQPVACVTITTNAVWASDGDYSVGSSLEQGQRLQLLSGSAQVSMACGADVVLQDDCAIKLASEDLVILEHGKLTAQAAKWATGFVVETAGLRITDLGTRFAVSADPAGVAEAHVLEGEVLAEPMKKHRPKRSSMLLKSGEAIRVSTSQATVDRIAAQREKFVDRLNGFRPFRPIPLWNTGIGQTVGNGDPHWQVTAGDPKFGPYPKPAVITPGDRSYLDNMPEASQWISVYGEVLPGIPPETVHTFETRFDLSGYDLETVRIVGLFLVDDGINELRINGRPVPFKRWVTTWDVYDFKSFHPIEIRDGFVSGENVISLDVYNSPTHPDLPADAPNPMGLRVEWQAFGCYSR